MEVAEVLESCAAERRLTSDLLASLIETEARSPLAPRAN